MAKKDLTDEELLSLIEDEEGQAYGVNDSALSDSRRQALNYYNGEPFGNEIDGRSQVVSRDVLDVVESALPQLLKVFVSGDQVVKFEPKGREDEKAAEQETDYVNHVVMEKNNGFETFYTWFKDALISKNGYVKVWYEQEDEIETELYNGLTDTQLQMLVQADNISVIEHTAYTDEQAYQAMVQQFEQVQQKFLQDQVMYRQAMMAGQNVPPPQEPQPLPPPPMLHDVKIEVSNKYDRIKICNVAPEDIMVSVDCREVSVQKARFVQHRAKMTRPEIEAQGWKLPENVEYTTDSAQWEEENARNLYNEDENEEPEILVRDTYYMIDGKRKRYVIAGNSILHQADAECVPIAVLTPHIMPHRHVGMSYADLCMDLQLIKSTLFRGQLDNMYLSNNGRYAISDRVNLEDMLTSRPGGVVRVKGDINGALMPLQHAPFPPTSFTMVEYIDSVKEKRTGITAYNQGLDSNALNKTATGVNQIMQASQQRIELVARTFAETGVKELFMLVHKYVRQYYTKPDVVRLRNEWAEVDPRNWKTRHDMSIAVGLGTGNKDAQLRHLGMLFQMQMTTLQAGMPIVTPPNLYETLRQIAINAGFKDPEQFVTDPKMIPPKPPQENPAIQVEKMKLQADQQKFQAQAQLDQQKFQAEAVIEQQKAQAQMQQEQMRSQNDVIIEREKINAQMELERWKAQLEAETKLKIAAMEAEIKAQAQMQQIMPGIV